MPQLNDKPKIVVELDDIILNFTGGGLIIIKKTFDPKSDMATAIELNEQEAAQFAAAFGMGLAAIHSVYQHAHHPITFQFPGEDDDN